MAKWTHEVSGTAIHPLSVNQSCTCAALHVCQSCQGQDESLRAVNQKLLAALEGLMTHFDPPIWDESCPCGEGWEPVARAREAIEAARK